MPWPEFSYEYCIVARLLIETNTAIAVMYFLYLKKCRSVDTVQRWPGPNYWPVAYGVCYDAEGRILQKGEEEGEEEVKLQRENLTKNRKV